MENPAVAIRLTVYEVLTRSWMSSHGTTVIMEMPCWGRGTEARWRSISISTPVLCYRGRQRGTLRGTDEDPQPLTAKGQMDGLSPTPAFPLALIHASMTPHVDNNHRHSWFYPVPEGRSKLPCSQTLELRNVLIGTLWRMETLFKVRSWNSSLTIFRTQVCKLFDPISNLLSQKLWRWSHCFHEATRWYG